MRNGNHAYGIAINNNNGNDDVSIIACSNDDNNNIIVAVVVIVAMERYTLIPVSDTMDTYIDNHYK